MLITAPQELGQTARRLQCLCQEGEVQRHHFLGLLRPSCIALLFSLKTDRLHREKSTSFTDKAVKHVGAWFLRVASLKSRNTAEDSTPGRPLTAKPTERGH